MKVLIDNAIPFIKGVFEPFCTVEYLDGNDFTRETVRDATALIIRTRTQCNRELLEDSSVRHIATATIGFDHIDTSYCLKQDIEVSTAVGCNARAVLQWVAATLVQLSRDEGWQPHQKTIGVVGVGNVGSLVSHYARLWGFNVVCCDPPRKEREGGDFVGFDKVATLADIITLHTPLNSTTRHLINQDALAAMPKSSTILNSSRGEVVDTKALIESGNRFAMDVWEGEPQINLDALQRAFIATPHIAGYSLQGKANATTIAVRNIAQALGLPLANWRSDAPATLVKDISWSQLVETIDSHFDIMQQSDQLKSHSEDFEPLRNSYNYRLEYF